MRLVFSTAMMNNPDILLIDEVIAVGDESFQKKSFNKIKDLRNNGKTIVFVSHSMEQIRTVCDKAIFLKEGEIKANGLPDDVIHTYLKTVYKIDNNLVFSCFDKKIKEIVRLEKKQKKIIDSISEIQKNIFNRFKIKNLKNNLERNKWEIDELKFSLSNLFENYNYLLETNLDSTQKKLASAYNKNDNKLIKKFENKKYEVLEDLKKLLIIKTKFCDNSEKNKINQHLKLILNTQSGIFEGTKKEACVLKELKELLEKEIKKTKNQIVKEKLLGELEDILIKIFHLNDRNKYGIKTITKTTKRKNFDDEKLGNLINILRKKILFIDDNIFNLQLEKKNYLITRDRNKIKRGEKEIIKLKQKKIIIIDEMNKKQELTGTQRKNSNVKIMSARFLNLKGNETRKFKPRDKFTIEITYNALKRVNNPVFGIGIFKDDGTHITGPNTKFHNFKIDSIKGKGKVYYTVDSLPLLEGNYLVTVAIHPYNSFTPYDVHTKLYSFKVTKNHIEDFGTFYINAKWRIEKN
jgi:ABC-type proline/glycine betaine transport system ATPase subunit